MSDTVVVSRGKEIDDLDSATKRLVIILAAELLGNSSWQHFQSYSSDFAEKYAEIRRSKLRWGIDWGYDGRVTIGFS